MILLNKIAVLILMISLIRDLIYLFKNKGSTDILGSIILKSFTIKILTDLQL